VATQGRSPANLDGTHHARLLTAETTGMPISISWTMATEDVSQFKLRLC
jgi:hypothetical protein